MKDALRPEDVLPDDRDTAVFGETRVRKGTVKAVIENIKLLESEHSSLGEKERAKAMIVELAPAIIALGLHQHATWKNVEIQKIFDEAVKKEQ